MDIIPFLATLLGCLLLGLEYGILIGVGINVLFVLYSTSRPNIEFIEEKVCLKKPFLFIQLYSNQITAW